MHCFLLFGYLLKNRKHPMKRKIIKQRKKVLLKKK